MNRKLSLSEAFLVLLLSKINDPRDIALVSGLTQREVYEILEELVDEGLVLPRETGIIIKKTIYDLTSKGYDRALEIYARIKNDMLLVKELLSNNRVIEARELISRYSGVIWLLKILKLIDNETLRDFS